MLRCLDRQWTFWIREDCLVRYQTTILRSCGPRCSRFGLGYCWGFVSYFTDTLSAAHMFCCRTTWQSSLSFCLMFSIFHSLIRCIKCVERPTHTLCFHGCNFIAQRSQHVSAINVAIFRVVRTRIAIWSKCRSLPQFWKSGGFWLKFMVE